MKEDDILKRFSSKLKEKRKSLGFSQEGFANFAGFSRSYYAEIENGKRNVSLKNLVKILVALNVEANVLISIEKKKER
jgi:transcriptional regulator with XRE-family HTH domain